MKKTSEVNDMESKNADVLIIGAGAAGLTAAIYCGRSGLKTLLCESASAGGKILSIDNIENYPAFKSVKGAELADRMREQAEKSGAEISEFDKIISVDFSGTEKTVSSKNMIYKAKCVIIATGSSEVRLDVEKEELFRGKGIHYCAMCDGAMYKNKTVIITGGGNSAVSAAVYLSKIASKVIMIRRKDSFHCEKILLDRMMAIRNIQIFYNWNITDILGDNKVIGVVIHNMKNNTQTMVSADAVFSFNGYKPDTDIFRDSIEMDKYGYIITDKNMKTNISGVYAAGDVCSKECRQLTTAVSDGTIAAYNAQKTVNEIQGDY